MFNPSEGVKRAEMDSTKGKVDGTQTAVKQIGEGALARAGALEEGELYAYRKGKLEKLPRIEDGMRKVRITERAYAIAMEIGNEMQEELKGYRPDAAFVISALIEHGNPGLEQKKDAIRRFVKEMFSGRS